MSNTKNLQARLESLTTLPPMPEMARKILTLGPQPELADLLSIVEMDPGLSAQLMRQAGSPFYGYRGRVQSVRDAVTRVLGVDRALHLAFGIAAGRGLHSPAGGPVGRMALWVHSVYSAALMQSLAARLPKGSPVSPGMAYLSGLLHNIGLLLLGHLYPADLQALNKALSAERGVPIVAIERRLYETDHTEMGMWLMRKWHMPPEVIIAVHRHHQPDYRGDYAAYSQLTLVADRVLQRLDLGEGGSEELPAASLELLGLTEEQVTTALQELLEVRSDLDSLANHLATAA